MADPKKGWLSEILHWNAIHTAMWPASMRRQAGFKDESLTPTQRKMAAKLLRERADELDPTDGQ